MELSKKVVIPAAGLGSRFYPITTAVPKEMLPIFNKPAIHYIVQEALHAQADELIIVTNHQKKSLQNYLEHERSCLELDAQQLSYVYQDQPLGLGHAVLSARSMISQDSFALMLPDDLFIFSCRVLKELIEISQQYGGSVIGVQQVPAHVTSSYGIIGIKEQISKQLYTIDHIVEKPALGTAPSNLAIVGRYVLSCLVFDHLEITPPGISNEIQLTDALQGLLESGHPIYAYVIPQYRYDIGTPAGWLNAIIHYALQNPEYAAITQDAMSSYKSLLI